MTGLALNVEPIMRMYIRFDYSATFRRLLLGSSKATTYTPRNTSLTTMPRLIQVGVADALAFILLLYTLNKLLPNKHRLPLPPAFRPAVAFSAERTNWG